MNIILNNKTPIIVALLFLNNNTNNNNKWLFPKSWRCCLFQPPEGNNLPEVTAFASSEPQQCGRSFRGSPKLL